MNCTEVIQEMERTGLDGPEILRHVRDCSGCLEQAAAIDPEILFRSLGGELSPPGGVEPFVSDVMHQVHLRRTEHRVTGMRSVATAPLRWGIAASLAVGIITASIFYNPSPDTVPPAIAAAPGIVRIEDSLSRPVIEEYASADATIVEVPSGEDLKVVMIFDETLPVDL